MARDFAGAIVVDLALAPESDAFARARSVLEDLARASDVLVTWTSARASLAVRNLPLSVPDATWDLARQIRERLLLVDPSVRLGADVDGSTEHAGFRAELKASQARSGGIATSWELTRSLSTEWTELEADATRDDLVHFPAQGMGRRAADVEPPDVYRYVARDAEALDRMADAHGFLDLERHRSEVRPLGQLLREPLSLVLGDPWSGKTWVAERLREQLRLRYPRSVFHVSFERELESRWAIDEWERWKRSTDPGYVIIDALDEGFGRGDEGSVASALSRLADDGIPKGRLHVLAFSRPRHEARAVRVLARDESAMHHHVWHLLPLDPDEAGRALCPGDLDTRREHMQRVRRHVRRLGDPRLVRDFNVLSVLAETREHVGVTELEERVIERLCRPRRGEMPIGPTLTERKDAATRIAAVLQFSGLETIDLTNEHTLPRIDGAPVEIAEAFPAGGAHLERAARALAGSALFERASGGYRFRQQFARERLAANALLRARADLVRRLTTGPRGGVSLRHRAVIDRLLATADHRAALEVIGSEPPRPLPDREALELVSRMLSAVDRPVWLPGTRDALAAFAHPAVARRAEKVLRDRDASEAQRDLALQLARANVAAAGWERIPAAVLAVALDPSAPSGLRDTCVSFVCGQEQARRLRPRLDVLLRETSEESAERRATILLDHLERGVSALEVAKQAPPSQPGLFDHREHLLHRIAERMSHEEVRTVVDAALGRAKVGLPDHVLMSLAEPATERWMNELEWRTDDVDRVPAALDQHLGSIDGAIGRAANTPDLRRRLFLLLVEEWPFLAALRAEDGTWLAAHLERRTRAGGPSSDRFVAECYRFAQGLPAADAARGRIEAWLAKHHAARVAGIEAGARKGRTESEARQRAHAERTEQRRQEMRTVSDVVTEILEAEAPAGQRVRWLGWVLFDAHRPSNVLGTFDTFAPERRAEIIRQLIAALCAGSPTELPSSHKGPFSGHIMYEAAAFTAAILHGEDDAWLTGSVVARWLRTVLFAHVRERAAVVEACHRRAPRETLDALLESVRRDAAEQDYVSDLHLVPDQVLADGAVIDDILGIAASSATAGAAQDVLWSLAKRLGPRLREALSRHAWPPQMQLTLRATIAYLSAGVGIGTVLRDIPPHQGPRREAPALLKPLERHGAGFGWTVDVKSWGSAPLAELAEWLLQQFPRKPREYGFEMRVVTDEMRCEELRDAAIGELTRREDDPEAVEALARLQAIDGEIADWCSAASSRRRLERLLAELAAEPELIPPRAVAAMLDDGAPSALRGVEDLFHLLVETLEHEIKRDTNRFPDLVWPPEAQTGAKRTGRKEKGKTARRNDQAERRLCEYIQLRLEDRLASHALDIVVEATEGHRDRPDLRVSLKAADQRDPGTIAIEVKWSHDERWRTGLQTLVQRYLRDQHRQHGIYIVGHSGRPALRSVDDLAVELTDIANEFQRKHVDFRIGVVVLPVKRPEGKEARSRPKRTKQGPRRKRVTSVRRRSRKSR